MPLPKNFNSWKYTSKIIRQIHNTDVVQHFRDIKQDDDVSRSRAGLKAGLIIRAKDSALDILNKQIIFRLGIQQQSSGAIASLPIGWTLQPGDGIPQLAIIYKVKDRPKTGYKTIYIPHYTGSRNPNISVFIKGQKGVSLELEDNSKIVVFAQSHEYGEKYISSNLLPLVDRKFRTNNYKYITRKNVLSGTMEPIRADFYAEGKFKGATPTWRYYF